MSELEKEIREMLKEYAPLKIKVESKDFHFKDKTIRNVPYEMVDDYGEVLNFSTAYHIELLLKYMYETGIQDLEYIEIDTNCEGR